MLFAFARLTFAAFLTLTTILALRALFAAITVIFTVFAAFVAHFPFASTITIAVAAITIAPATAATAEIAFATLTVELLLLLFARGEINVGLIAAFFAAGLCFAATHLDGFSRALFAIALAFEVLRLRGRHRGLHRAHEPKIVVGVLRVILAQNPIARTRGIARELQVAFVNH